MGDSPRATLFYGYYVGEADMDDEDCWHDDIDKPDIMMEATGFEYSDRIVFIPKTLTMTDWNQAVVPEMKEPSQAKIDKFMKEIIREGIKLPSRKKPGWLLAASYN